MFLSPFREAQGALRVRGTINPVFLNLDEDKLLEDEKDDAIGIGLLRSNGETSAALRLLLNINYTSVVKPTDGSAFEELLQLHLHRLAQVNRRESTFFGEIRHGWPPTSCNAKEDLKKLVVPQEPDLSSCVKEKLD